MKTAYERTTPLPRRNDAVAENIGTWWDSKDAYNLFAPTSETRPGWLGTNKGLLQVFYERGWIDKENWRKYTLSGRESEKDEKFQKSSKTHRNTADMDKGYITQIFVESCSVKNGNREENT